MTTVALSNVPSVTPAISPPPPKVGVLVDMSDVAFRQITCQITLAFVVSYDCQQQYLVYGITHVKRTQLGTVTSVSGFMR